MIRSMTRLTTGSAEAARRFSRSTTLRVAVKILDRLLALPFPSGPIVRLICNLEGGMIYSATFRDASRRIYGVDIGEFSYGECLGPGLLPSGTSIGRYCSFGTGVRTHRANHPSNRLSQHPFFYDPTFGFVDERLISDRTENPLTIGHDVWIGQNVILTAGCRSVGNSSIIAAGAVVVDDVPPFSIVGGIPAKVIRQRLNADDISAVEKLEWWNWDLETVQREIGSFTTALSSRALEGVLERCPPTRAVE